MSAPALGAIIGVILAAIWAIAGFDWVLIALLLAAVGALVGMVVDGRIDLAQFLGHRHGEPESVRKTKEK